jgi:hypothetical protein
MSFAAYFFIAWSVGTAFFCMKKTLTSAENAFVYLLLLMFSVNWYWILYEELKWVEVSREPLNYTAFLISRSVSVPLLAVIALNGVKAADSRAVALVWPIASTALLTGLTLLGEYLQTTTMHRWHIGYDVLFFLILHLVAYYGLKFFRYLKWKEAGA